MKKTCGTSHQKYYFAIACVLYLFSRVFFLIIYNFQYTDQDQVVMWAGTVFFSHGHVIEPMWLGQNYGSMLESLLAVPLYWCKVPLNIALPISSLIIGLLPLAFILYFCIKEKKYFQGWMVFVSVLLFSVDMDVLTSIPRSFIPGYCATVGGLLMCVKCDRKNGRFLEDS